MSRGVCPSLSRFWQSGAFSMYGGSLERVLLVLLLGICHVAVKGDFMNCKPFVIIPEESYDRNPDSVGDLTKRPLGFMFGMAEYPPTSTNLQNPCVSLTNLTGRSVEVMVETFLGGNKICVKSDDNKVTCGTGKIIKCSEPGTDTVKYEFYCDPSSGCEGNVKFWYRLRLNVGDPDDWCTFNRENSYYPSSLYPLPSRMPIRTTPTSRAPVVVLPSVVVATILMFAARLLLH